MAASKKCIAPDHLTMSLFTPGMSAIHRAGLGGLACTLKAMERQSKANRLPFEITRHTVTLRFGKPEDAGNYLERLFQFAFKVRKDGLIVLPGQHDVEPSAAVLADLQAGLTQSFLQHGKARTLEKLPTAASYDPEGNGNPGIIVNYRKCSWFKHQDGWKVLIDKHGCLVDGPIQIEGPVSPGTVVRHVAYTGDTAVEDPAERILPLFFALVGCIALPVN